MGERRPEEIRAEIKEYERKIAELKRELASCGLFAGKRKKELKEQISRLEKELGVCQFNLPNILAYEGRPAVNNTLASKVAESEEKIAGYLENAAALRENGYTIRRNVSPADYNADEIVRNDIAENGDSELPDYFSVNKYGKPVSFVISKDGKEKLFIVVYRRNSGKAAHLYWIDLWARDNNVPVIKLYAAMENAEAYVMDRVYKELHLD